MFSLGRLLRARLLGLFVSPLRQALALLRPLFAAHRSAVPLLPESGLPARTFSFALLVLAPLPRPRLDPRPRRGSSVRGGEELQPVAVTARRPSAGCTHRQPLGMNSLFILLRRRGGGLYAHLILTVCLIICTRVFLD